MSEEPAAPAEEKDDNMPICPCCGKKMDKKPINLDSKVVDDYLASIMTGVPFSHTFELFNGRLTITVSALDKQEGLALYRFVLLVEPFGTTSTVIQDFLGIVNMYSFIRRIVVKKDDDQKVYIPAEHIFNECRKLVDIWEKEDLTNEEKKAEFLQKLQDVYNELTAPDILSSTPLIILNRALNDYKAVETLLLQAGFDENFWKGIELH